MNTYPQTTTPPTTNLVLLRSMGVLTIPELRRVLFVRWLVQTGRLSG